MKKLSLFLSLFLVALSFNGCTSDDDNDTPDKIIGKWRLSQIFVQIDQDFENYMPTECEKKSTIEFFENGTYKENDFEFDGLTNTCEALAPVTGTWKNLGNSLYDISDLEIPGLTVSLQLKITFESNKMIMEFSGTGDIEGEEIEFLVKVTYIENDTFVPDSIIGKWRLDQEFTNNEEADLTDCAKTMTIQFFEAGTYEEKDFYVDGLECVAHPVKNGTWKNLGNDMYEISDIGVPEFKVTFANNKMTVEFTDTEEGITADHKLIFIKLT
jgi:hypothetical protein